MYKTIFRLQQYIQDKELLTLWLNNLLVVYAFLLPISQSVKATIFSFMLALFIIRGDVLRHLKEALYNPVIRAFFYIFLTYLLGLLWSDNVKEGLYWLGTMRYGLYLILFYAIIDGRYIDKVISAFVLGMFVSELTSYAIQFAILPWRLEIGNILFYQAYAIGDPSPFLHHIHYGVALAFTVVLLAYKTFFSQKGKLFKLFMSLFMITATTNIFITGGRTGYVTFFMLVGVLALFYLRRVALVLLFAVGLVFMIAYNTSAIFHQKIHETEQSIEQIFQKTPDFNSSLGARAGVYYYSLDIIKEHPIFGVGTGDSMDELHKKAPNDLACVQSMPHEHNQYLSVLLKLGIVGLIIYMNIFYQIFRYKQDEKDLRYIMIFVTLAIAFGTLMTQFNLRFFLPLWAVFLAITLSSRERKTIHNIELNDKKQFLQIIILIAIFGGAHLLHQLM